MISTWSMFMGTVFHGGAVVQCVTASQLAGPKY